MATSQSLNIVAIPGSLRKASINHGLLRAAAADAPDDIAIDIVDIAGIPVFDADDLTANGVPDAVQRLHDKISQANAVLIATPEYNFSVPGGLKNVIDWLSRCPDQAFNGKAIAIMGASPSNAGTARAQYHLRQVFVFLNGHILNKPELMVSKAGSLSDSDGNITDDETRRRIAGVVSALADWARKLS